MNETTILQECRLAASEVGCRLFRNNVGKLQDKRGRWVDFGLCVGSSDLIGWTPVKITEEMVGKTLAVFTACEVKVPGKKPTKKQEVFMDAVNHFGGIAFVATSKDDVKNKLK